MENFYNVLDSAIDKFSTREYYDHILEAKQEYFDLAGKIEEEDEDYESRMNGFNYWYLTQRGLGERKTLLQEYIESETLDEEVINSLLEMNHSLFEYKGTSFTGKHSFIDILHDQKFSLPKNEFQLQLIKDDIFIARSVNYQGTVHLLNDISVLPHDVRSILVKESKKVRKLKDPKRDLQFLMAIEKLKTKWRRYGHLDPKKIFNSASF
jgi:hypothetical protein